MKINYMSVIFWFNTFENHKEILEEMEKTFQKIVTNFEIYDDTDNLLNPVVVGYNTKTKTEIIFSKINLQLAIDFLEWDKISNFKEQALQIFDFLTDHDIEVLHSSVIFNGEMVDKKALDSVTKKTLNPSLISDDLVDVTLKVGAKYEDLFYKVITILNKKQLNLPKKVDDFGHLVPIPLISWYNSEFKNELIEINYEINDKYSFDTTNNYHTTTFYLNKLLYVLENDLKNDVNNLIENGHL